MAKCKEQVKTGNYIHEHQQGEDNMRIAVKDAGQSMRLVETASRYRTNAVSKQLGNIYQRAVWLDQDNTLAMVFDDSGQMKQAPLNFFIEVPNPFSPVQPIAGKVVFVRTKPVNAADKEIWDYEVEDLRESDIEELRNLLSDEQQVSLTLQYFTRKG